MGTLCSKSGDKSKYNTQIVDKSDCMKIINNQKEIIINSDLFINKAYGSPTENYTKLRKLGSGGYGVVWKVKHNQTGLERAMKMITKNPNTKKETETEILNEIDILKKLDHPNIVKIFEFYNTNDGFFLITEYCGNGELYDHIKKNKTLSEKCSAHVMFQLLSAINYCHGMRIMHRDLKPENILIENINDDLYDIKIIDFGTAKIHEKNKNEQKVIGSSYYIAPEVLKKEYNEKCDLWSCGIVLYIMLSGDAPFLGETDKIILEKVKKGKYDITGSAWKNISSEAKDLIKHLLVSNSKKRYSASEALNHKWFKKFDFKNKNNFKVENLQNSIDNILKYNPEHKIQQIALAYLIHNIPQLENIKEAYKIFNLLNEKSDGQLRLDDLRKSFKNIYGKNYDKTLPDEIFKRIDFDNKGYIQYEEFVRASIDKKIFIEDEVLSFAFSFFDKDGSGEITIKKLKEIFISKDKEIPENIILEILEEIDLDKDQIISYIEFKTMMKKILR